MKTNLAEKDWQILEATAPVKSTSHWKILTEMWCLFTQYGRWSCLSEIM